MMSLRRGDEGLSTVARFQCVECAATYDLKVQSDKPINPEGYAKRAQQDGWKADPWKRNRCYCPRCAGPQKKMNDPNSELNKVVPLPVQPVPREITPEARQRIRNLLDKHFDDGVGMYLDGMSDQRVSELANVPRAMVEQLREAAYGTIRVDPVLAELRQEASKLRADAEGIAKQADALLKQSAALASRVEKLAAGKAA